MYINEDELKTFGNFILTLKKFGLIVQIRCSLNSFQDTEVHKIYKVTRRNNE